MNKNRLKTLITQPHPDLKKLVFSEEAISKLKTMSQIDWAIEAEKYVGPDLLNVIENYDVILSGWRSPKLTKDILDKAHSLKFVGHAAGTIVPVVDESIYDRNIKIVNANSVLAASTAEGAFALIMSQAWNFHQYANNATNGIWSDNDRQAVLGLEGQTVGIIGLGEISKRLIKLMQPLNPKILIFSNYCSEETATELGAELCSLDELLIKSRIISIHSTLTSRTRGLIGEKELDLIQNGALLVNTARAAIIDEQALIKTLKTGRILAAFDVFNEEPLSKDHPLLNLPNVLSTPHMLGFSSYWKTKLGLTVINDLERFINKVPLKEEVTKDMFRRQSAM